MGLWTYGAAMVSGASQIPYVGWHKIRRGILPKPLFNKIRSNKLNIYFVTLDCDLYHRHCKWRFTNFL